MRQIFLDDKQVWPESDQQIKVTVENPLFRKSGSYTLDVVIPLDVLDNRDFFGNLCRKDVTKRYRSMSGRIMVDNKVLLNGTAVITEVTEKNVKVQFLGGRSELKYISKRDKTYIDKMDLQPKLSEGIYDSIFQPTHYFGDDLVEAFVKEVYGDPDDEQYGRELNLWGLSTPNVIGLSGIFNFLPIFDVTNGIVKNNVRLCGDGQVFSHRIYSWPKAVQPNLWWITKRIFNVMGYTIGRCDIPIWIRNDVYIASARQTVRMADALPHWTVSEFVQELEKLLNVTVDFDENEKVVNICHIGNISQWITLKDVIDEHKAELIDTSEAEENLETSNLKYTRSPQHNWDLVEEDVLNSFKRVVDNRSLSESDIEHEFLTMTENDRISTVIECQGYQWVWRTDVGKALKVNNLGALIRDKEDKNIIELKMCPVGFHNCIFSYYYTGEVETYEMAIENSYVDPEVKSAWESINENSVDKGTDKEDRMELYIVPDRRYRLSSTDIPMAMTDADYTAELTDYGLVELKSLSLRFLDNGHTISIGDLHEESLNLNKNSEQMFTFLSDDVPDVTAGFLIMNKRWLCKKMEIKVDEQGLSHEITGYFCEILS